MNACVFSFVANKTEKKLHSVCNSVKVENKKKENKEKADERIYMYICREFVRENKVVK